ncbi:MULTISPECIES: helix-turn-helix domain-containing protein [Klebsiella/Raoultella group]|uniref:helix-turn-helix domain-containing protein n=1 Tax=Klebsiella/Raoultella group TaxID=2890311 RepID=UPI000697FDF0|nr:MULTISPECIES: helix-turn-helix domain-containing protein [Klebsiella/Raoultella group]QLT63868.1 helix-turn-helix domain-containing protein [Klebsiella oxytoca]AWT21297.1 hypothetical protein DMP75_25055 [Klebsiella michiganensis]MBR7436845.1 bacteriophage CI repressor [Klebsiella pneumoniae]MCJ7051383.1 helix-turn-helix domain containing protein [Klebsiella variicola]MDG9851048.1 helix-turn-helix domain containing protein [Klebsiella grimontii]
MNKAKEIEVSFTQYGKESIRDRIKSLFKGRSLRRVSLDWDLPYSTLNNYFARSATPSVDVLVKISDIENVSLNWLATGREDTLALDESDSTQDCRIRTDMARYAEDNEILAGATATPLKDDKFMSLTWSMFFEALNHEEKLHLIDIYAKIGAKGVLALLSNVNGSSTELLNLSPEEQRRLMHMNEQIKKGSSETGEDVTKPGPSSSSKKAS